MRILTRTGIFNSCLSSSEITKGNILSPCKKVNICLKHQTIYDSINIIRRNRILDLETLGEAE